MTLERLFSLPLAELMSEACALRDVARPGVTTYSRKVFIPLTQLCRDVCGYCTFAKAPRALVAPFLSPDAVLDIARGGAQAGCKEALFTLGDKPELRYAAARRALAELGFRTTIEYLEHVAGRVLRETGLIPHINAGVLGAEDYGRLRRVSGSMGLMLESTSERLCARGGPHFGSPDKRPAERLRSIEQAGEARIPFTTGLLIGIGETREERLDALEAIALLHQRHGHIQEVIVQNFRAKSGTRMADAAEPDLEELLWTLAAARLILPADIGLQAPPNLSPGGTTALLSAGIDDFGGISPVTIDYVNPEAPWPQIKSLAAEVARNGRVLLERLTVWPRFIGADGWLAPEPARRIQALSDAEGLARDTAWAPGLATAAPGSASHPLGPGASARLPDSRIEAILGQAFAGRTLAQDDVVRLFSARGTAADAVVQAADELRRAAAGDAVTFVVNRNINYTNLCTFHCSFCAFSKSSSKSGKRDRPYDLPLAEIALRAQEAARRGATEVCLQGGIHPRYTGQTYLDILGAVKQAAPDIHVHAFSPLEVAHGAGTLGLPVGDFLRRLKDAGLGSLPGTAAEILDNEIRKVLCPDKLPTAAWLSVVGEAHRIGLRTTATIMFGSVERPIHWARHLDAIRRLQLETGGFTEFVPLPFVHMESPIYRRGLARQGPTWREAVLMHAISRIVLHGAIPSIQASWVKLGLDGAAACLRAGVNDLGGVLMNESISRAAGAAHGQEVSVSDLASVAAEAGRPLQQRSTLYGPVRAIVEGPRRETFEAGA